MTQKQNPVVIEKICTWPSTRPSQPLPVQLQRVRLQAAGAIVQAIEGNRCVLPQERRRHKLLRRGYGGRWGGVKVAGEQQHCVQEVDGLIDVSLTRAAYAISIWLTAAEMKISVMKCVFECSVIAISAA